MLFWMWWGWWCPCIWYSSKKVQVFSDEYLVFKIHLRPDTQWPHNSVFCMSELYLCCCIVIKSCPILCNLMDYSLPGSLIHGISQARILEWYVVRFLNQRSNLHLLLGRQILYYWANWEAHWTILIHYNFNLSLV